MSIAGLSRSKLRLYAGTVLEFGVSPRIEIDLRRPLTARRVFAVREAAEASEFAIITADNPLGSARPDDANRQATGALLRALETAELSFAPAIGRDPEDTHREASWLVAGPLEPVLAIAREFQQDAVFRFNGERFLLVETASGVAHPLPLELS